MIASFSSSFFVPRQTRLLLLRLHHPPPHLPVYLPSLTFQRLLSTSLPTPSLSFSPPPSQPLFSLVPSGAPKHCHPSPEFDCFPILSVELLDFHKFTSIRFVICDE